MKNRIERLKGKGILTPNPYPDKLESDCLIWPLSVQTQGYGHARVNGKLRTLHRLIWEWHNGPIPEGMLVLHKCDIRRCFAINHLFLGTHIENAIDRDSKGRANNWGTRIVSRDSHGRILPLV